MTELNLILSKNGQAQLADGSSTLNMGYEGNKSVYALRISPRDEWANLTISAYWHTPNKEITPPATLFANNVANVPAIVTAISGERHSHSKRCCSSHYRCCSHSRST